MSRSGDDRTAAGRVRSGSVDPQSAQDEPFPAPERECPSGAGVLEEELGMCALPSPRPEATDGGGAAGTDPRLRRWAVRLAQQQAWARHFACHDLLTGLPRRSVLMERLEENLEQAGRRGRHVALLLVEIEQLEWVRTQRGQSAGDAVLQRVAESLARSVRGADTVCRCGGDRFSVILSDVHTPAMATAVAERIRAVVGGLPTDDGGTDGLSARIGVAVSSSGGDDAAAMIRRAELEVSGDVVGNRERS